MAAFASENFPGTGGNAALVFQFNQSSNRDPIVWYGPFYSIVIPTTTYADLRIESEQWVPNLGTFQFSLDINRDPGSMFGPSRGRAVLTDLHLGRWTIKAGAGDVHFNVYNLDFGLSSLYRPNTGLRGFQIDADHGKMQYSLFGGRTTAGTGYFGESKLVSDQSVFGARAVTRFSERLAMAMSLLHISEPEHADRSFSQSTNSLTAGAIYRLTPHLHIASEASLARYRQTAVGNRRNGYELSGFLGARMQSHRGSADISLLRLGPAYAPFSYTSIGDRAGISGSGDYRINEQLSLYGSFNRWRNNVAARPEQPVIEMNHQFLGTHYRIGQKSTLGARISVSGMHSADAGLTSSRMKSLYLDFSQQWRKWRFTVRGKEIRNNDANSGSYTLRRRMDVEARLHLKNNTNIWTSVGILRDKNHEREIGGQYQSGIAGSMGINWSPRDSVSLYSEAAWNQEFSALSALKVDNLAFNGGLRWLLPRDIVVNVYGRYSREAGRLNLLSTFPLGPEAAADLENYLRRNSNNDYQITFSIRKSLKWGKSSPPRAENESVTPYRSKSFGTIEGVVFEDLNQDGIMDENEKGVANIAVILNNRERVWVDSSGRFAFKTVPVGEHGLSLELSTIPASYDVGPRSARTVEVVKKRVSFEQFPLVRLGKIRGRVRVMDPPEFAPDGSLIVQAREKSDLHATILISLNPGAKIALTDSDGEFEFTSLPAGDYTLQIQESSLPDYWAITSAKEVTLHLPPGGRLSGVEFVLEARPRPNRLIRLNQVVSVPSSPATPTAEPAKPETKEKIIISNATQKKSMQKPSSRSRKAGRIRRIASYK